MTDPLHSPIEDAEPVKAEKPQQMVWELRQERERTQLSAVLSTDDGQALVSQILDFCNVYRQATKFGYPDAIAFDEGKRAVGLWLIGKIGKLGPLAYPELLKQHAIRTQGLMANEASMLANTKHR